MKILVTAGPTREYIDDIRFLSNASTGSMGYAIAGAAVSRGHQVTLISGPTAIEPPSGLEFIRVISALEMYDNAVRIFKNCDAVIMNAAVCDYRPASRHKGKIKKHSDSINLHLVKNPDILYELGMNKGKAILVGFALEVDHTEDIVMQKLCKKNLDLIVVNGPGAVGSDMTSVEIYNKIGFIEKIEPISKKDLADKLVGITEGIWRSLQ